MKNYTDEEQKKIFSENIKYYLNKRGLTQADLAARVGLGQSTIAEWYYGRKYPRPSNMQAIADALGVYLSDLREPRKQSGNTRLSVLIPVLGSVPAGIPIEAVEDIIDYEEISEEMARDGEYFALRIKGTSMEPKFSEGDVVVIRKQEQVDNGQIAVVMVDGDEATIKKFFRTDAGIMLVGLNPSFSPLTYTPEQAEQLPVRVIGRVVELRAKF